MIINIKSAVTTDSKEQEKSKDETKPSGLLDGPSAEQARNAAFFIQEVREGHSHPAKRFSKED